MRGLTDILEKIDERSGERNLSKLSISVVLYPPSHSRVLPDGIPTTWFFGRSAWFLQGFT